MTSPTLKRGNQKSSQPRAIQLRQSSPFVLRRCTAWVVEVSLVAASALVPYGIGVFVNSGTAKELVPLHPVLATTEDTISKIFALPRQMEPNHRVPPLTNLLWWGALLAPTALGSYQLYRLAKTGQTLPKQWLGVRVVNRQGHAPGFKGVLMREVVGRWGIPFSSAYLIWRYSGAVPDLGILIGLTSVMLVLESASFLVGTRRRTWHDQIAGTRVVNALNSAATAPPTEQASAPKPQAKAPVESAVNAGETVVKTTQSHEQVTTIVLTNNAQKWQPVHLWQWMRQNPGITLVVVTATGMLCVLGTFVLTQVYIQSQANQRESSQQNNEAFLALVKQLSSTTKIEERRAAILAIAQLEDPRAAPLLVDLLGQEYNPSLIETIQQALVGAGIGSLPPLRHLNQALMNDRAALQAGNEKEQNVLAQRLRANQRAIAKLVALHNVKSHNTDLSRTFLSSVDEENAQFKLVWKYVDLSGINFRGSVLSNADLRGSSFFSAGADGRLGTFDDWIADLSGADLHDADLRGANLSYVAINNTNLIRTKLNKANFTAALLRRANLSSSSLVGANFRDAVLTDASFTGANLAQTNFFLANLQGANLGQVDAAGANFAATNLVNSTWQGANLAEANFQGTNLRQADLSATTLIGANLRNTQLQDANLLNANLSQADLRGANLSGANFEGVTFSQVQGQKSEQILLTSPADAADAKINGVNFAKVKNLGKSQMEFICSHKGLHPDCQ